MPTKTYAALVEHAQQQYGYVTPDDARAVGLAPASLRVMAARETLEHLSHGLYRVPLVPRTELDAYMEAVLWTRRRGVLSHETALDLYDLCDVNPAAIHLTLPKRLRVTREIPKSYRLHRADLRPKEVTLHEGIPIVTAERAIRGTIEEHLGRHLIDQAIDTARRRGLIRQKTADLLRDYSAPTT